MNKLEKIFEQALRETLIFEDAKVQTGHNLIILRRALGSGRYKTRIGNQISRAMNDSNSLMKDLGVSSAPGNTQLEKARSVLAQAVRNDVMSYFFLNPTAPTKRNASIETDSGLVSKEILTVSIPLTQDNQKSLGYRDSCYYVWLTLVGAYNAGILPVNKKIRFMPEQRGLQFPTIYVDE